MPPHASRRLNLVLVPASLERTLDEGLLESQWGDWQSQGRISGRGRAGPQAEAWVEDGFVLLRVDRPPGIGVYGNRVGGFHVDCPSCEKPLAGPWGKSVQVLKTGAPWALQCPNCGLQLGPNQAHTQPAAAIARFALELRDVGSARLRSRAPFQALLGEDFQVIAVRG